MRLGLLGFGLIGGSIARAVRASGSGWSVAAWSPTGSGPRDALADGTIDAAASTIQDAVAGAELIVLAAPPLACLELLDRLGGSLRAGLVAEAVVTDVASTKGQLVDRATHAGLRFVGGHPMAGRETSGWAASTADLFVGRPWVIVPGDPADVAARERVESLARACGAVPVTMSAGEHDAAVAAISHLPLVVAAALVEAVAGGDDGQARTDWPAAAALAASGWQGATRLARGDVEMGVGIVATNAPAIAARLRDLRAVLDGWLAELERSEGPDHADLAARLAAARRRLEDGA
ncbi:MAG: prephenate dehydrogenase [Chloroflexota bacterium]|nr:prephenate dehydrogenase [Chloroflexota bacterium]